MTTGSAVERRVAVPTPTSCMPFRNARIGTTVERMASESVATHASALSAMSIERVATP